MKALFLYGISRGKQYFFVVLTVLAISVACFAFSGFISYRVIAFVLLVAVSLMAMFFDILPVLVAAALSALAWDFFFIPPRFTFRIGTAEDTAMLAMYFVIAMVNAVLTFKIRQFEKLARQKEERANTLKLYDALFHTLSHELKTPIATVIGATDSLQTDAGRLGPGDRTALLAEIGKAAVRLDQQVENLLNMSRLETGILRPRPDWCDVHELIYGVINNLEEDLKTHAIRIEIDQRIPLFKLDYGLMDQVLKNLVQNAIVHTTDNSSITVSAGFATEVKGHFSETRLRPSRDAVSNCLVLEVKDNGPGFPDGEIEHVFDKFYRLNKNVPGGTGLGLSIVKGFVESLGGTVNLSNVPGGGAAFTIRIPAESTIIKNQT